MDLIHVGKSFSEAHPIMNVFSSYWAIVAIGFITVVYILSFEIKNEKVKKVVKCILEPFLYLTVLIVVSLLYQSGYKQDMTYKGQAKVVSLEDKADVMRQRITLKNKEGKRTMSLYKSGTKGIQKGDTVKMIYTKPFNNYEMKTDKTYFNTKTHKPKNHIKFNDMPDLEDDIELKKNS